MIKQEKLSAVFGGIPPKVPSYRWYAHWEFYIIGLDLNLEVLSTAARM